MKTNSVVASKGAHLQGEQKQHHLVLTFTPRSNGCKIRVRCRCMAEYRNVSLHYYNYDWLADVETIEEIKQIYEAHLKTDPHMMGDDPYL
jgi:hypothetical protein